MAIFRVNKTTNYTVMSNYHLRDKNLSLKAKGLLSYMLSLPDDWDYSINGLVAINKESVKAIRNILDELKANGYLIINKFRDLNGRYEYEYEIYESPDTQKGDVDKRHMEKGTQINTNKQNTNNKDKYDKMHPITKRLIKSGFISSDNPDIPYYDNIITESLEEYDYYIVDKVCKYILDNWNNNKGFDENGNKITNKYGYFKMSFENNLNKLMANIDLEY